MEKIWTPSARLFLCQELRARWGTCDITTWNTNAVCPPNVEYQKEALPIFEEIRQKGIVTNAWGEKVPNSNRALENQVGWLTTAQSKDSIQRVGNGANNMRGMAKAAYDAEFITFSNYDAILGRALAAIAVITQDNDIDQVLTSEGVDLKAVDLVAKEGRRQMRAAYRVERSGKLRKTFIKRRTKTDKLFCDVCNHHFERIWKDTFTVHHTHPLSLGERETTLDDLALLCALCHQFVHQNRGEPLSIEVARVLVRQDQANKAIQMMQTFEKAQLLLPLTTKEELLNTLMIVTGELVT